MILQLFGILEAFAALFTLVIAIIKMYFGMSIDEPRENRCFKVTQLAFVQFHVDLMGPPQMRVQSVPIVEFGRLAFGTNGGLGIVR